MTDSTLSTSPVPQRDRPPGRYRWAALTVLCLAQFMLVLDVTVVNVALPDIGADLHLGRTALTWVVTSYTLAFGGLMLLGGRLADALGARRTFVAGLVLFTGASLTAGLAGSAGTLLTARVAQGVGAALLSPSALSLVTSTFEGPQRQRALGVWAAIGGAGSAAGVLLGGLLTSGPGWNWIFYVNVPVGVLVLALLPSLVAAVPPRPARLDLPGAVLVTGGTAALIKGLVAAGDGGWASAGALVPLGLAVVLYAAFALTERASRAPLIDVRLLTRRPVVAGAFLILVATGLLIAAFFLSSVHLQRDRGYSALGTGLAFLPVAVATAAGAHLAGRLLGAVGARSVAAAGMAVTAAGLIPLARTNAGTGVWSTVVPSLSVAAFGIGAVFVTAFTIGLALVPAHESGLASGALNTFHEVGGSIGVAVVSTIAASGIEHGVPAGYAHAYAACAGAAAGAALIALVLVPRGRVPAAGGGHGGPHGH
ncbi:DHA2 family efflux MFS transporter permease subunit [Actinacidiphila rubida]|uniref:Drug resistance transporter, EmrB/QacA subfamily n=1 Tax=Actinacidiphila rubida TaxID=310780 RepID=A0A1H8QIB4_9ACTN|nr:DHA2 family efflux MFS transporter permease subunit [Actinacidiphila rubida]SEO53959.1 drug resistance transporter, EmrB/QacA subfamily [Actinacidiphila rubida]